MPILPLFLSDRQYERLERVLRGEPGPDHIETQLAQILEQMTKMSQGFTDLTAAVGDLTGAVNDETAAIAAETTASNAASDELTALVKQLLAASSAGDDAAAETAAQAIEAQVALIKSANGNISTSATNLAGAVQTAQTAAAAAEPPPPPALVITGSLQAATVGVPYTGQVSAAGGVGEIAISATGLPDGLSVTPSGLVSGTPTTVGQNDPTFTVADSSTPTAQQQSITLELDVLAADGGTGGAPASPPPPPAPPVITPDPTATFVMQVGVPFTDQLSFTGGAVPLSFSIESGTLPDGITLSAGGLLSGTPTTASALDANGDAVLTTVSIQAHDANNSVGVGSYGFEVDAAAPPAS
jgi:hypothetical protein